MNTPALRNKGYSQQVTYHAMMIEKILQRRTEFDVIHSHLEYVMFPWIRNFSLPAISTIHNSIENLDLTAPYNEFPDVPMVAISDAHRAPTPHLNWLGTIYHGMPRRLFTPNYTPDDYLLFLGRFSVEKRPDLAIDIALKAGHRIKLAAKLDKNNRADFDYYKEKVEPLLSRPGVEYLGEVGHDEKKELLAGAKAMLFPIKWPEPFGLVMIEAMASGTPVIAFPYGSVPEIIESGITGFLCDGVNRAVEAVERLDLIDRKVCRARFEERFSVETMTDAYMREYEKAAAPLKVVHKIGRGKLAS
jgi:glycosyltransferase involved in cell wall biosynthesis